MNKKELQKKYYAQLKTPLKKLSREIAQGLIRDNTVSKNSSISYVASYAEFPNREFRVTLEVREIEKNE